MWHSDNDPVTWGQVRKIVNAFSMGLLIFALFAAFMWGAHELDMIGLLAVSYMIYISLMIVGVVTFIQLLRILKKENKTNP